MNLTSGHIFQYPWPLSPLTVDVDYGPQTSGSQYVLTAYLLIACLLKATSFCLMYTTAHQYVYFAINDSLQYYDWFYNILKFPNMIAFQLILSWLTNWGFPDFF